jgi:PAS domain S-box-containing protein
MKPAYMFGNLVNWLERRPKASLTAAGLVLVVLIGAVDRVTPAEMIFAIFYLIPITFVTWFAGRNAGILIAFASGITWLVVNLMLATPGWKPFIPYWNALSGLLVFLGVVFLISTVKALNAGLEDKVEQRTRELSTSVADHQRTEDRLRTSEERFRQLAEGINEVFWMTDIENGEVIYVSPAYEVLWGRTSASWYESPRSRIEAIHPEDRERVAQATADKRSKAGYDEEYRIVRPDGAIRWIHDRAFPIFDKTGEVYRLAGIAEDVTQRKRLERKVLEVSDQEQRRIGRDLHDGLCQHLTATMFASKILEEELAKQSSPQATQAGQIAEFVSRAISQARNVARGLDPVKVATNGLMSALEELAASVRTMQRLDCVFRSDAPVLIDDDATAIHLYRIAQEAMNNAVKHAQPKHIEIGLDSSDEKITLTVRDDGVGLPPAPRKRDGMGLQSMNYRARAIGATLEVRRGPAGGTIVTCALPKNLVTRPPRDEIE